MSYKALILFVAIVFVLSAIGSYYVLYDENISKAIIQSSVSSFLVFIILIAKRKWDSKQKENFK